MDHPAEVILIDHFDLFILDLENRYFAILDSSLKSLFYFMKGMVDLKKAELEPEVDKILILRNFKLAILYRPD